MSSAQYVAGLLASTRRGGKLRLRSAVSQPKRRADDTIVLSDDEDDDDEDENDIRALVVAFERFDGPTVARLLLNNGDPLVNTRALVEAASTSAAQRERLEQKIRLGYLEGSDFWRQFVTTCFPGVTRLPADMTHLAPEAQWKEFARRIFYAIASITLSHQAFLTNDIYDEYEAVLYFAAWPSFRHQLQRAATCSQLFNHDYTFVTSIEEGNLDGISLDSRIEAHVLSETKHSSVGATRDADGGINRWQQLRAGLAVYRAVDVDRDGDDYSVDYSNIDDWTYNETGTRRYYISAMDLTVRLNPSQFITDYLFGDVVRENIGHLTTKPYTMSAAMRYRDAWLAIVQPTD